MRVTLLSIKYLAPGARPVVALLRRLGYDAALRVVPEADYAPQIFDSRARTQASMFYWAADYPAPSNFLAQLLSCEAFHPATRNNLNAAEFCSRAIDSLMRSATRAQAVNVQLANRKWAAVDRALVDAAPWLPLYNPQSVALLSRRAGGHRYNPIHGTLIDQLWVH
jgi:peptide/nickel transport system substrate-binding protein